MLIDTHCHLSDGRFDEDRDEAIARARDAGVELIVEVAYDIDSSKAAVKLASSHDGIFAVAGVHPHDAKTIEDGDYEWLYSLAMNPKVIAVGEIGLDFYYDHSPREIQIGVFREQLNIAREQKLPVVIHDRDAHGEVMEILDDERVNEIGGVMHCFSGSWEMAKYCLDRGLYISIGGSVTFKNARKVVEVAEKVPIDRLLVETDSPYLTPVPFRGRRNEPAYVRYVAEKIAEIRGISVEELAEATTRNARRLFGI